MLAFLFSPFLHAAAGRMDQTISSSTTTNIHRLQEDVIKKICAGEVIHRPLNVVKELLENSLDAGATSISVTVRNGGLKQIIIQDNGCGIRKEDLKVVCERFTTSKLESFDDFQSLRTFGFRGEALSSVSTVSQVTIVSKTVDSICAYKAEYRDGRLNDENAIIPIASNDGTTIIVENLFYNMPTRKAALSSEAQEFTLIQELMLKYAIIFSGKCGFILKKHGDTNHVINTKASYSVFANIDRLFSASISPHLIPFEIDNEQLRFKIRGFMSNNDVGLKKYQFIMAINSRLVECGTLKKSVKESYKNFLMKGDHPFVLLLIDIDPKNIDVNVHPTKTEVCFLYDNEIIASIVEFIENRLRNRTHKNFDISAISLDTTTTEILNNNTSRTSENDVGDSSFNRSVSKTAAIPTLSQTTIKSFVIPVKTSKNEATAAAESKQTERLTFHRVAPLRQNKFVRIDSKLQRIDQYLNRKEEISKTRRTFEFASLNSLLQELTAEVDQNILNILSESTYVGCVNENFALIQHQLNLFMLKLSDFNQELFYQIILYDFGNFDYIQFQTPLSIRRLMATYFDVNHSEMDQKTIFEKINDAMKCLVEKRELLDDYFSIKIDPKNETIEALPVLVEKHDPNFSFLPELVYRLVSEVDWTKEKSCFRTLSKELARFYTYPPNDFGDDETAFKKWSSVVENEIYPLYKTFLLPSGRMPTGSLQAIADVTNLYRVFERC